MANPFFDLEFAGEQLYNAIYELGEEVSFQTDDIDEEGNPVPFVTKMCISDQTSNAATKANKVYKFNGEMIFSDRMQAETLRGCYFKRKISPEKTYLLLAVKENPYSELYCTVELVECNETIDIVQIVEEDNLDTGRLEKKVVPIFEKVEAYVTESMRVPEQTDVGQMQKTITTITYPSAYLTAISDKIMRNEFTRNVDDPTQGSIVKQQYNIQNLDNTLMSTFDETTFYGVISIDVVKHV